MRHGSNCTISRDGKIERSRPTFPPPSPKPHRRQMKKKLTILEQLEGFAEAQIMYADQQEAADLKGNLRKVEADTTVRREIAERILQILDNKED